MRQKQLRPDVQLPERLTSVGIIGKQLRAPLKHLRSSPHNCIEALKGALNWVPWCREGLVSRTADVFSPSLAQKEITMRGEVLFRPGSIRCWGLFMRSSFLKSILLVTKTYYCCTLYSSKIIPVITYSEIIPVGIIIVLYYCW